MFLIIYIMPYSALSLKHGIRNCSYWNFFTNLQEDQTTIEVDIDPRVHRRLIGARGASIRRVMDQFKVDIRFPRPDNPNGPVAISGAPDNVEDARDHLLVLEEEYVSCTD